MALFVIICVIMQLFCTAQSEEPFFRKDYTYLPKLQSFYKFHTGQRTWWSAKKQCQLEGAELFVPENQFEVNEVAFLWRKLEPQNGFSYVGISDLVAKGEYETVDGRTIDEVYGRWAEGEPNDKGGKEHCLVLTQWSTKLNDENCENAYPFICKKTKSTLEWNTLCELPDTNYQYNKELGKCYKYHVTPMNWTDAQNVCVAEQSYLAVVNSQAELAVLLQMNQVAPRYKVKGTPGLFELIYVGLTKQEGGFYTLDGVPLEESGYSTWGKSQPDNGGGGNEACGSLFFDGVINDLTCSFICFFICEHDLSQH